MTPEQEISQIEAELEEARADLHHTLSEVNAKVEDVEGAFQPAHLIQSHPLGAACLAAALGFATGVKTRLRLSGPLLAAGFLGYILVRFSAKETVDDDHGQ